MPTAINRFLVARQTNVIGAADSIAAAKSCAKRACGGDDPCDLSILDNHGNVLLTAQYRRGSRLVWRVPQEAT